MENKQKYKEIETNLVKKELMFFIKNRNVVVEMILFIAKFQQSLETRVYGREWIAEKQKLKKGPARSNITELNRWCDGCDEMRWDALLLEEGFRVEDKLQYLHTSNSWDYCWIAAYLMVEMLQGILSMKPSLLLQPPPQQTANHLSSSLSVSSVSTLSVFPSFSTIRLFLLPLLCVFCSF